MSRIKLKKGLEKILHGNALTCMKCLNSIQADTVIKKGQCEHCLEPAENIYKLLTLIHIEKLMVLDKLLKKLTDDHPGACGENLVQMYYLTSLITTLQDEMRRGKE